MHRLRVFLIFMLLEATFNLVSSKKEWNYDTLGPDYWKVKYSEECGFGEKQSPINILTDEVVFSKSLKNINFISYNTPKKYEVINNGHTVLVKPKDNFNTPSITGSNFGDEFVLHQMHFHWGYNDYQGSEHLIDYEKFPLELHLVHGNDKDELAVVGFLFKLTKNDNPALDLILKHVKSNPSEFDESTELTFALASILPNKRLRNKFGYYRYMGSLTTPPCTEGIFWTVYDYKIGISSRQLEAFHYNDVKTNFRDPQNIHTRTVYSSRSNMGSSRHRN